MPCCFGCNTRTPLPNALPVLLEAEFGYLSCCSLACAAFRTYQHSDWLQSRSTESLRLRRYARSFTDGIGLRHKQIVQFRRGVRAMPVLQIRFFGNDQQHQLAIGHDRSIAYCAAHYAC